MKANELMIGDWVRIMDDALERQYLNGYKPGQMIRVTEILDYGINPEWGGAEVDYVLHFDIIEPIPLTPEILEKNGFIPATNGVSWYLRDDDTDECLLVLNKIHNAFVMSTAGMTIGFQYVHQLQHLLRLCGIKKEIEL